MKLLKHVMAATLAVAIGSLPAAAQQSNITLRVASFAGPFGEGLQKYSGDLFTKRTGIKIEYIYGNPADHLAKMIASRGREAPFDLVAMDDDINSLAVEAGVLGQIDPTIVTELKYLYPEAVDKDRRYAALFFFALGIAYNKDKFKQAGIAEPTSWKDLWDPKLSGHISIPDIVNIQGRDFIIQTAKLHGGGEDTPDKGIDQIAKIKAHSYYTGSNTVQAQLESGDVWVTVWNNMRAGAMAERGLPIGFVMPKEGTIGNTDTIAMVATTKYPREAQTLMNYMLSPFGQLGMAKALPVGPTNMLLKDIIAADPEWAKKAPVSPEAHRALYLPNWEVFNRNLKKGTDYWNRVILK
jgi:putative spermidine/putrescine transport system substrate-binding protein